MPQDHTRADLEHHEAIQLAEHRARKQLAALAQQYLDHVISTESYPGRGLRFTARARAGTGARPWLVLTRDLDELRAALPAPAPGPPATR
jgi:hypothetical protein